jgi:hypothetical protein
MTESDAEPRKRAWASGGSARIARLLLVQAVLWVVVLGAVRTVGVQPEGCPAVSIATIDASIGDAVSWLESEIERDGRYRYGYDRSLGEFSSDYNITRHAGVVMSLYQLAASGDLRGVAAAERGLVFIDANLRRHDDWIAFAPELGLRSIGATSLALAALLNRRQLTDDQNYDEIARDMGRFILAQQEPRGSILSSWDTATGEPVPETYGRFATGEAFWALTLLAEAFPEEEVWQQAAGRVAHYLSTDRDDVEELTLFTDHWAAYAFAELDANLIGNAEREYARKQAGLLGTSARLDSQSDSGPLGQLARGPRTTGSGLGTIGEGLGGYWRLSRSDTRFADLESDIADRLRCLAGRLVERQATALESANDPHPQAVVGAWFTDGYAQMDDQQHAMSALIAARELLRATELPA